MNARAGWTPTLAVALALLVWFAAAAAQASVPGGADAARVSQCGRLVFTPQSGDKYVQIRTSHIGCRKARRLLRRYRYNGPYSNKGPRGWSCHFRAFRAVGGRTRCVRRSSGQRRTIGWSYID